jgi:hypothetical protein
MLIFYQAYDQLKGGIGMKKVLFTLAACAIIVSSVFAAEPVTKAGSKAILFGAQYAGLQPYEGAYGVGLKYYLAEGLALRPVLLFNYRTDIVTTPAITNVTYNDEKDTYKDGGLELGLEKSLLTQGSVNVFAGGVAGFSMGTHDYTYGYTISVGGNIHSHDIVTKYGNTTAFNVAGLLGFEYFFSKSISISGEYRLGYSTSKTGIGTTTDTEVDTVTGTDVTITQTPGGSTSDLGFSTAGLKLGIYF